MKRDDMSLNWSFKWNKYSGMTISNERNIIRFVLSGMKDLKYVFQHEHIISLFCKVEKIHVDSWV